MICFMFPGQPMSLDHPALTEPAFADIIECCREVTGCCLPDRADGSGVSDSVRLQLLGTAVSLYRNRQLLVQHGPPAMVAEHSMGIYPALAACGSLDMAAAFGLTWRIGCCLSEFGAELEYALASVIGLDGDSLATVAANHGVYIANYNTSRHFLLAGLKVQVTDAAAEAEIAGAFSVALFPSDAPLHTPLLNPLASDLTKIVADYTFGEPQIPLMEHYSQTLLNRERIPGFIVDELCRPVYWDATYRAARSAGMTRFFEVGASQALTKFNRWIDSEM